MEKTPKTMALEFAEKWIPYRPWVDADTHQADNLFRDALQKAWLDGYSNGRSFAWLLKKEDRQRRIR